jgi:SPP1 gp7 family putative phage head morphogenesis protein
VLGALTPYIGEAGADPAALRPDRLLTTVRTNLTDAYNQGRVIEARKLGKLGLVTGMQHSSVIDSRTTPLCRSLQGRVYRIDDGDLDRMTPPLHHRCRSILLPVVVGEEISSNPNDPEHWATPEEIGAAKRAIPGEFGGSFTATKANAPKAVAPVVATVVAPVTLDNVDGLFAYSKEAAAAHYGKEFEEGLAISDYRASAYDLINRVLRSQADSTPAVANQISAMDSAFGALGRTIPVGTKLYRGASELAAGSYSDGAFVSTTLDREIAASFADTVRNGRLYTIELRSSRRAVYIDALAEAVGAAPLREREILLDRGVTFVVTGRTLPDGTLEAFIE